MPSRLTRPPQQWAEICRSQAASALDAQTRLFLSDIAREFELLCSEGLTDGPATPAADGEVSPR